MVSHLVNHFATIHSLSLSLFLSVFLTPLFFARAYVNGVLAVFAWRPILGISGPVAALWDGVPEGRFPVSPPTRGLSPQEPSVADDSSSGSSKTFTQDEVEKLLEERTAGLKANRDELAREAKAAKAKLANYDGVDPEEHKRLKATVEEAERKKAAAEGNWQTLEKQLKDLHASERAADQKKIAKAMTALERRGIRGNLVAALAKADAKPAFTDLLTLEGSRFLRMRETEDDFEEFVADEKGNPRMADSTGTPMSIEVFVNQVLKAKYPDAFNGSGSSGGGASKSGAGSAGEGSAAFIEAGDGKAFLANVAGIAKGTTQVR